MRTIKIFVSLAILLFICVYLYIAYEPEIYQRWVSYKVPAPQILQIERARRFAIQISPNAEGIKWFGIKWSEDGEQVNLYNSTNQIFPDKLLVINQKNDEIVGKAQTIDGAEFLGLINALPFKLYRSHRESLWAGCQGQNFFLTAKLLDDNLWETRLWKGNQLLKTFQPEQFHFAGYQNGYNDSSVGEIIEYSHFSKDCRYGILDFGRDVWLLNTTEKSFTPIFTARQFIKDQIDPYNGYQFVWPGWAPDNHEFVFGDWHYGFEIYDVQTNKRSWLLAPGIASGFLFEWSNTGNWIITDSISSNGLVVISPTGKKIAYLKESCDHYVEKISWAPMEDKVAFICNYSNHDDLVIWDLSNLNSN
jgi:hypothetical protein